MARPRTDALVSLSKYMFHSELPILPLYIFIQGSY